MTLATSGLLANETEAAAARWVRRELGTADHERRVLAIANRLFELVGPRLGLTEGHHALLRLAALVHDIGRCLGDKGHPTRGAAMLGVTTAIDLVPAERRRLAFLTRYHRGAVPPPMKEEFLTPADARRPLRAVLALLRAADALDNRHLTAPRLTLALDDRRLTIRCAVAPSDVAEARRIFKRRKKYRLLESFLGPAVRVSVEPRP